MGFVLHSRLQADTLQVGDFPLCRLLLMDQAQLPWCVLVPRRADITELHQLTPADQGQLMAEITHLGSRLLTEFGGDKLNVAAIGNQVPQLHLHLVVRWQGDGVWPQPVWGRLPPQPYSAEAAAGQVKRLQQMLFAAPGTLQLELA